MNTVEPPPRRRYRLGARAESTARTREAIIRAAVDEFWAGPTPDLRLESVARRADVTVPTVLRHFDSKATLLSAAVVWQSAQVEATRDPDAVTGLASAVRQLAAHYEEIGDGVMRMLAAEATFPELRALADAGRAFHRDWCRRVFATTLAGLSPAARRTRLAQLVAVCDVHTWYLLRRQEGLGARATSAALHDLLRPLVRET